MRKYFALFLSLLLIAASSKPELPTVVFAESLAPRIIRDTRARGLSFLDPVYVCPTREHFVEMLKFCAKNRTNRYAENRFDCEDHAREFQIFAARYALKKYSGLPAGIAVGVAVVRVEGVVEGLGDYGRAGYHALSAVMLADGRLVLVEPRDSKWIFPLSAIYEGTLEVLYIEF